jgi:hypothetical protein
MSGILSMIAGGTYSTKPDAPTIGSATATSTTTATVAFTAPAKDGGATITSYTATSSPGGVTGTLSQAGSGTITVSGLTTGTAYTFTVTATNSVGTSVASSASNSITTFLAPANTVAPVVSGTATRGQTLSTTDGTWNGIPTPTFAYQWQRAGSNIGGATSSTYTLVSADVGNAIRCVVTATNTVSAVSANSNATAAVAAQVPGAPTSVSATSTGTTTATVSFSAPADNGGAAITTYTVSGGGSGSSSGSPISVTGLSAGTSYTFTVTATNSAGTGPASSSSNSITTTPALGQSFGGGYFAGTFSTNANGTATHYLVVAPRSAGDHYSKQFKTFQDTNGAISSSLKQSVIDGPTTRTALLGPTYGGTNTGDETAGKGHPGLEYAANNFTGGYSDWYIPAKSELEMLYYNFKPTTVDNRTLGWNASYSNPQDTPREDSGSHGNRYAVPQRTSGYASQNPAQTSLTAFQQGGSDYIGEDSSPNSIYYWSCSEYPDNSAYVWCQPFNSTGTSGNFNSPGFQRPEAKTSYHRVRLVRRVAV